MAKKGLGRGLDSLLNVLINKFIKGFPTKLLLPIITTCLPSKSILISFSTLLLTTNSIKHLLKNCYLLNIIFI